MTHKLPLHPLLLVAAYVLAKAVSNGVDPPGFARPLIIGLAATLVIITIGALATRSWRAGALTATLVFGAVLSRDPVVWLLQTIRDLFGNVGGTAVLAGLVAIVLVGGGFALFRLRGRLLPSSNRMDRITSGLNVFSAVLMVLVLIQAVPRLPLWLPAQRAGAPVDNPSRALPDMYLLLLDGYPRADELAGQFGFDDGGFLADLEQRGFEVEVTSRSNYTNTALTLPSLFTMQYLTPGPTATFSDADLHEALDSALRDGAGLRGLRAAGYELVATSPGWEHVSLRTGMDRMIERPELTDLEQFLLWNTWIPDLPGISPNLFYDQLHSRVLGILTDAERLAATHHARPMLAFVHVPAPHLPLAFGEGGAPAPYPSRMYGAKTAGAYGLTDAEYAAAYAIAIDALNANVLAALDQILADSDQPPVVVVFSDHGYDGPSGNGGDSKLHNLFAALTPGHPHLFQSSSTPVNLLRTLLRAYAGADVGEPLPDRYFHTSIEDHVTTIAETDEPG